MKISRRKFLKLVGSGIVIVVVGGTIWRAFSNGVFSSEQGPAYEPWNDWKTESEKGSGPLSLVASAILAANPHNTQPWLFVVNPNRIDLFAAINRNIGAMIHTIVRPIKIVINTPVSIIIHFFVLSLIYRK
jgi:hypothetical protein